MKKAVWEQPGSLAEAFWKNGIADIPIYDMHGHMGSHNAIYFARCEAPEMVAHLRRIGVRRLVFSHHYSLMGSFRNQRVHAITARFPDILRMYVSISPHQTDFIAEDLEQFDSMTPLAIGFKFLPDYHKVKVTDPRYEPVLNFASERRLPILVHTWGGSPYDGPDVMLEVATRYPQVTFFMAHSFSGDLPGAKRVADACPNVYFELTSLPGQHTIIERLCADIGSHRLLFGTDMPWFDEYQHVGGILSADISEDDKHNILYRNVEKLLGKDW